MTLTADAATSSRNHEAITGRPATDLLPAGLAMGMVTLRTVHLQVGDVETARAFYVDELGFESTARLGRSALFVSAGGYHHHMAMNTWNSTGVGPRRNTLGLGSVDIELPPGEGLGAVEDRLRTAGRTTRRTDRGLEVRDPWRTLLVLSEAAGADR
ncbi:VOC family protein [Propionibacteriaceae bacterium Y2011]|uniref:VOC family protein n=1 Tax=Microlunatus sp. Y2014 TaxID=3418488 RepID=UPI003B4FAD5D